MTNLWVFACVVPALFLFPDFANGAPVSAAACSSQGQPTRPTTDGLPSEEQLVSEIIARSFPNLIGIDIRVKRFQSDSDYFRTSFSAVRFLGGVKMRYFVLVNPEWRTRGAPIEGVQAILAHELAHVEGLTTGKRVRLFGLAGLVSKTKTARFERRADLETIARGYACGLKVYRAWLYNHVPAAKLAEKRRDYFSPEEIDAILAATAQQPCIPLPHDETQAVAIRVARQRSSTKSERQRCSVH